MIRSGKTLRFAKLTSRFNNWERKINEKRVGCNSARIVKTKRTNYEYKAGDGKKFATLKELCAYLKISVVEYAKQKKGIVTQECVDFLGKRFKNKAEMCKYWGIKPSTFSSRIKRGMPLREALITPVISKTKAGKKKVEVCRQKNTENPFIPALQSLTNLLMEGTV